MHPNHLPIRHYRPARITLHCRRVSNDQACRAHCGCPISRPRRRQRAEVHTWPRLNVLGLPAETEGERSRKWSRPRPEGQRRRIRGLGQAHESDIGTAHNAHVNGVVRGAVDTHAHTGAPAPRKKVRAREHDVRSDECTGAVAAWRGEAGNGAVEVGRHGGDGSDLPLRP